MVLLPEKDRPQRTISTGDGFTLRRYPISGAPVDTQTAARLQILGPWSDIEQTEENSCSRRLGRRSSAEQRRRPRQVGAIAFILSRRRPRRAARGGGLIV